MSDNTVLLIDPSPLSREGLQGLLDRAGFKTVTAELPTVESINPAVLTNEMPDLVLVDPGSETTRLTEDIARLRGAFPLSKLVVLSGSQDLDFLNSCFKAAVDGFVSRSTTARVMMQSLSLILADQRVFPSRVVDMLLASTRSVPIERGDAIAGEPDEVGTEIPLSEREIGIMQCLVAGHSNKAIAGCLQVTEATVKVHLKSILRKIRVNNRTQAAIWGIRNGIGPHSVGPRTSERSVPLGTH